MFLGELFVSFDALLSIALLLFSLVIALIYLLHFVMPKPFRTQSMVRLEEMIVPALEKNFIRSASKTKKTVSRKKAVKSRK